MSDQQKRGYLAKLFREDTEVDLVIKKAVKQAVQQHKNLQQTVAAWNGSDVVIIDHHEIPLDEHHSQTEEKHEL